MSSLPSAPEKRPRRRQRTAAELVTLAESLRLTEQERKFCEVLALDPKRNLRKACEQASNMTGVNARVQGHRWARKYRVIVYLEALTGEAQRRAVRKGVASLTETLLSVTNGLRAKPGDYLDDEGKIDIAAVKKAPQGALRLKNGRVETDPNSAATQLLKHYQGPKKTATFNVGVWQQVVQKANGQARPAVLDVLSMEPQEAEVVK